MNLKTYLKTWEGIQNENRWSRVFIAGLVAIVLVLSTLLFSKKTIVTIQPFTLHDEAWVTADDASVGYKEAWGFALAQLFGNVTPASVGFIKDRIDRLLSPAIYNDVINVLEVQSQQIINDRVSIRFEPRFVEYEQKTGKVFVYGYSFTKGMSNEAEVRNDRTYEFELEISNYVPVIEYMDTYEGRPHTTEVLERLQRREERRSTQ
ncbi:TraE/TraK family type IV conjugative transfer system protein [Marinobacterium aestuariivivens]|uniref:TraE/TraK family type IV conjugative transfer system protein n=1 Tax=Marinobacterium aestuariivivens TaxID=1698799 RepID=A0ABW2A994_9GAMM